MKLKPSSARFLLSAGSLAALLAFGSVPAQAVVVVTPATDFGATTSADDVDVQGTAKATTTTATADTPAGGGNPNSTSGTVTVADSSIFTVGQAIVTTVEATTGLPDNTWVREITNATTVRVEGSGLPWGYNKTYTVAAGYMNAKNGDTLTAYEQVSAQPTADVNNLVLSGPGAAITLQDSAVLSIHGTLSRTGGSDAIASINGNGSIKAGATDADLVVNTPTATDSLQINSFIDANGTGGLTKTGPGTLRIASPYDSLSYTGKTVVDGGTLAVYFANNNQEIALGAVPGSFEADNITLTNGATLQYVGRDNNSAVTVNANRGITLGAGTQTIERLGQCKITINSPITGTGGLYFKSDITNDAGGTNFAELYGANTYTGDTTFSWGPVITTGSAQKGWHIFFKNKDALQNSTVAWGNVTGSAENAARPYQLHFDAGAGTYTLGGLSGSWYATTANWANLNDASKTIAIGNNNQTTEFSGPFDLGATNLEKIGSGTLTLSGAVGGSGTMTVTGGTLKLTGANTFTGDTTVTAGTLSLGNGTNNSNLADSSTLVVASGAVLDLNYSSGDADTVFILDIGGTIVGPGNYGSTASGATNGGAGVGFYDAYLTGTGVINTPGGILPAGQFAWDGGGSDIAGNGNGASDGGGGTWDTTIKNWDGGVISYAAWGNTTSDTAIFGGSAGEVALDADLNIGEMIIGGSDNYFIGTIDETHSLAFGGANLITVNGVDATINAGISGSPTINYAGRSNNSAFFALEPTADVSMTLGTVNCLNTNASNKQLRLGGPGTGNVVDQVTWTVTGNQLQVRKQAPGSASGATTTDWTINQDISLDDGRIYVDEGTLILGGTDNFMSHSIEVADGGRIVLQGNWRIHDENEDFRVLSGGIVAPGGSVGTATFNWNSSRGNPSVGLVDLRTGSTYEWEVGASATDVIALTEPVVGGEAELVVASGTTLKVVDAGGSPSAGDQLTVFTYDAGVVTPDTATLNANMHIDLMGTTWTGTPSFVNDTVNGIIYVTGISSGGGPVNYASWQAVNGTTQALDLDHDGDGVSNGVEYFIGGPNGNTTGFTATPGVTNTAGTLSVTWTHAADYTGVYGTDFEVETSTTLQAGSWTTETLGVNVIISGDDVTYTFPAGAANYARLVVTGP